LSIPKTIFVRPLRPKPAVHWPDSRQKFDLAAWLPKKIMIYAAYESRCQKPVNNTDFDKDPNNATEWREAVGKVLQFKGLIFTLSEVTLLEQYSYDEK